MRNPLIAGSRNFGRVVLPAAAALTSGGARWSEFHSVQPDAGSDDRRVTTRHGLVIGPTGSWNDLRQSDDVLALAPWHPGDSANAPDAEWHLFAFDRYACSVLDDYVTVRFGAGAARTVRRTLDLPS